MSQGRTPTDEAYQSFLSETHVSNVWKTELGNIFAISEDGVFVERGVGPLTEQRIHFDRIDSYLVTVTTQPPSIYPYVAVILAFAFSGIGVILNAGLPQPDPGITTIFASLSALCVLAGGMLYLQFQASVEPETELTLYVGRFELELVIPEDASTEIDDILFPHLEKGESNNQLPSGESSNLRTRL